MTFVLFYFILGFVGHFLLLFVDEGEMITFREASFEDKMTYLILNTSLGIFTFIFGIFSLGLEIYLIEKENYLQSKHKKLHEKNSVVDEYDYHADRTKYL